MPPFLPGGQNFLRRFNERSGFSFFGRRFVQGFGRTSFGQKRAILHQDAACPIRSGAILADPPEGLMR